MINIIEYLDDKNIPYWTSGKNVSQGWIGLQCPFCEDQSNHLGINLTSKIFTCFICGTKGGPEKLVTALENVSYSKAKTILKDYGGVIETQKELEYAQRLDLPKTLKELQPLHKSYLESRNFSPEIYKKYRLECFGPVGEYKFRFFIPFFYKGRMVTFSTRDVTGKQEPKYIICPIEKSVIPVKQTLYNIDSVRDTAIVVEGVTDVWRIGDGAVALHGVNCTIEQMKLLAKIRQVYIMLDSSAASQAETLAENLCAFTNVEILELTQGDPADLPETEVKNIQRNFLTNQ